MQTKVLAIFFLFLFGLLACERNKTGSFIVEGKVINIASRDPIDSVMIILNGGNPMSNPFMPGFNTNPPNGNNDTAYTDENGEFRVEVKHESAAFIGWRKKGYKNGNITGGNNKFFTPGLFYKIIEYEAECDFYPVFKKKTNNSSEDTLKLFIASYRFPKTWVLHEIYYGKSPFKLKSDFGYCTGDAYFHYKLIYKENDTWNEKIDSVYVKSFQTYSDTIYY